ncbi:pinopsin-like [Neopelma chrysocephalum]|uniref:pinopsin-like n=1 Tax=Neopelma chrysocephalum TaxID=114329 RepID=UPI000FCD336A|nr:pinopsin-like [Neopelma chrysocephalum]
MNHTWTYNLSFGAPADPVEPRAGLTRSGHTVVAVFLGFIFFFGFLNNFIVLILFCKFKTLRNPVNMLLLNISISDMLVCISGTTLSFASNIRGKWIGGEHACRWYGFVNSCFGIVSLISLAVLSYERYSTLTLCNKRSDDYQKALLAVGGSWIYSLIWTVPPLIGWSSYGVEGAGTSCSVRWSSESAESTSYIICLFIFCLVVPVMVMMYCYGRLLYAVKQVGKIHKNAARKREYHVLFMVITTVICYLVCWIPYGVIALLATFGKPGVVTPVTSIIPSILAKSSTVCNPIIYILMNKQFYKCFRQLFHCQSPSSTNGEPTCHSKVTVIQLNQRTDGGNVCNNEPYPERDSKVTSLLHSELSLEPISKAIPPQS